jgi:hypothetical protein
MQFAIQNCCNNVLNIFKQLKKAEKKASNKNKVLKFAGLLNNKQAVAITNSVKDNFNSIEGEW